MKKFFGSLFAGLVIGLPWAFWWIPYEGITYSQLNVAGVDEVFVREMDFNFVFYTSLLVLAVSAVIFMLWSWIDKKREERFYRVEPNNFK